VSPDGATDVDICATECGATCCHGGAFLRPIDRDRLKMMGDADAIAAGGQRTKTDDDGDCVLLDDDGRCSAYAARPLDCQLFPLGFVLDDARRVVDVVVVGCPLSERPTYRRRELAREAVSALESFDADTLRAYEDLEFTSADQESLLTIPYDALEINL